MPLPRLLILLALAVTPAPASATVLPDACPCWDKGGPFYTPASWCYAPGSTQMGFQPGTFAQTVTLGPVSYCRNNALFRWTTPAEHQSCIHSLHLACSPLLAVAYIDRNDNDVFDLPDGLIAKLVDTDGNGADADDVMVTDVYPATPLSTAVGGSFTVKATPCVAAFAIPTFASCTSAIPTFSWTRNPGFENFFAPTDANISDEIASSPDAVTTSLTGIFLGPTTDQAIAVGQPGDQNFIDVDIFAPSAPF